MPYCLSFLIHYEILPTLLLPRQIPKYQQPTSIILFLSSAGTVHYQTRGLTDILQLFLRGNFDSAMHIMQMAGSTFTESCLKNLEHSHSKFFFSQTSGKTLWQLSYYKVL